MKHINPFYSVLILLMLFAFNVRAQQLQLQNLNQPYGVCLIGSNQNLIIEVKNIGAVTVTSAQFGTQLNGLPTGNFIWNGTLNPGNSTTVNLGSFTVTTIVNDFLITAYDANGSGSAYNDTALYHIVGGSVIVPSYVEDFEGAISWGSTGRNFTSGINQDTWQLGIPGNGTITPTIPGSKAWVIGIDSDYADNIHTYLYSPIFNFSASGFSSIWFHFTANANLAANDSLTVEYTTDLLTWTQLPAAVTITGNNGGWGGYGTTLSFLASQPQVQLRYVFYSDNSGTSDGIAIDDVEVIQCVISQLNLNQLTPVSCFGACDGVLEAVPLVGYPPFTYLWSTGETTQSISNVCPANYDVTVTDVNGCTGSTGITVNQPTLIIFNLGPDVSICAGDSVVLCPNVSGGNPPYIYSWNTTATTSCITAYITGTYTLTVTDANGCTATDDITITVNPLPVVNLGPDALICDGASIMLNAGGSGGATYQWSTGDVTQTTMVTTGGTYTVTVTNIFGCTGSDDVTVTVNANPVPVITGNNNICSGQSTVFDAGGGFSLYQWSNGATTQTNTVSASGAYTVTVTNINGCTGSTSIILTVNSNPTPVIIGINIICDGESAVFDVGGGYTSYLWSNGTTTQTDTVSVTGTYSVTVANVNGCSGTATMNLTVNPNPTPILGPDVSICSDGSIMLDAGFGGATYQWSDGNVSQTIVVITGGVYTVTVTDFNGCTGTDDIVITQLPPIVLQLHEVYNCVTSTDSVYIVILGGSPPYTYLWSTFQTTSYLLNPGAGTYTVDVTDVNGCTGSGSINVMGALDIVISKMNPECYGYPGIIGAGFNGVPPFSYLWSNGATVVNQSALAAGTYTVTITDAVGCSLSKTDSLIDPDNIVLKLDSVIPSGCGASDGSFYYSFTPAGFSIPWINGVQFATSINLAKGVYNIYIVQNVCASNTLQVVVPDSCEDVYPGDANYDLVADNKDLLQIGLAYGNTGPVRPSASNTWIAQTCPDWSNWFNTGVNQKHADCDGNGIIDANDTVPILLNYGLTHLLKQVIIPQTNSLAPDLYLTITQDTTGLSDSVFINVMCGTAANPVDSIYGLAFRLYYDSALVDTSSIYFDYSNSFLGTAGVNLISINKNFGVGYADFAITRTDHINASGHGPVAVMGIVTTDNVAGKMLNPVNTTLQFSLGDVYAVTANEFPITLDVFGDSIFLDSNLTGINYLNWDKEVKVYPNPANNYFTVASSLTGISKITILNQLGEIAYNNEKPQMPQRINVSNINNGVYILRIETKEGVMHRKIQIIK